jgi:hypothetical protein
MLVAGCGSSGNELKIHGHGTVLLDGTTFVCSDTECDEPFDPPAGPAIELEARSTDLDWVLTSMTGETGEVGPVVPGEDVSGSVPSTLTSIEVGFEPLSPCSPPAGLSAPPTLDSLPRACVTADRISIGGSHLGLAGEPACVYLDTSLAETENEVDAGGQIAGLDVLLASDVPADLHAIMVRTDQGRAWQLFARLDVPPPAPTAAAPNPTSGNVVLEVSGTDMFADMVGTLVGPETVDNLTVHGTGPTTADFWLDPLTPGDYQLTLADPCGAGTMPGVLTLQ